MRKERKHFTPEERVAILRRHLVECGTFYYLCSILDGFSRFLVHWDLRESMREADVEVILRQAKEKYPEAKPRIISDNGPQFTARDFKEFIRISGMTHVRDSPYYPQSNGKIEPLTQIAEKRVHSAGNTAVAGRCTASDRGLRGALQQRPPEAMPPATSRRRTCWLAVSRRLTANATASWKPPDTSARAAASKPRELT